MFILILILIVVIRVMKITSFQLTIQQGVDNNGYADNFYINIDDKGLANISRPYKSIPVEEQLAIEEIVTCAIKAHLKLVKQVDNANKELKLEEYRPIESMAEATLEEEKAIAAAKLSAAQELELVSKSASPQSCALGDEEISTGAEVEIRDAPFEEVSRGADGDIDKPKPTIVITKTTEEDDW